MVTGTININNLSAVSAISTCVVEQVIGCQMLLMFLTSLHHNPTLFFNRQISLCC
jgi:hypothetical protein